MKVLGVILARSGSKTIKDKNIVLIAGKPLMVWSIEAGLKSGALDRLVVSTDSPHYANIAHEHGADAILRPDSLCKDETWSRDALKWTVLECERIWKTKWDIIAELPAVNPLKTHEDVRKAVELMKQHYDYATSVVSVSQLVDHHPMRAKRLEAAEYPYEMNIEILWPYSDSCKEGQDSRKQDLEPAFIRNGAVYVMKRETLIEKGDRFGGRQVPYFMPEERGVNMKMITAIVKPFKFLLRRRKDV